MRETSQTTLVMSVNKDEQILQYKEAFASMPDMRLRPDFVRDKSDIECCQQIASMQFTLPQATLLKNRIKESGMSPKELAYHDYIRKHLHGSYEAYVTISLGGEQIDTICFLDKPNEDIRAKLQKTFTDSVGPDIIINKVVLSWFNNNYLYHCRKDGYCAPDGRKWCKYHITKQYWN